MTEPGPGDQWVTRTEAATLFFRGRSVRVAVPVALVVGTVLSLVNQGSVVAGGQADHWTAARIVANYVTPFLVASFGFLAGRRVKPKFPLVQCEPRRRTPAGERDGAGGKDRQTSPGFPCNRECDENQDNLDQSNCKEFP